MGAAWTMGLAYRGVGEWVSIYKYPNVFSWALGKLETSEGCFLRQLDSFILQFFA